MIVFTICYFCCSFSCKMFTSAAGCPGQLKGTLKPLKAYNPTKTAPISESRSGLVTLFKFCYLTKPVNRDCRWQRAKAWKRCLA